MLVWMALYFTELSGLNNSHTANRPMAGHRKYLVGVNGGGGVIVML